MQFQAVQWVDVAPFLEARQQPVAIVKRDPAHSEPKAWAGATQIGVVGEFWVPTDGLLADGETAWSTTRYGDAVRVPMHAFKTQHISLPDLFGLGVQIGMAAVADLRQHTHDVPQRGYLIIGHQCTDLRPAEEAFRVYIGIALQTK